MACQFTLRGGTVVAIVAEIVVLCIFSGCDMCMEKNAVHSHKIKDATYTIGGTTVLCDKGLNVRYTV